MDSWTFACAADMHAGTPRSFRFQPAFSENWQTARGQIVEMAPVLSEQRFPAQP